MPDTKPYFSLVLDDYERFNHEVNFELTPDFLDNYPEWSEDFLGYSDKYTPEIKQALNEERLADAITLIRKDPKLFDEVRDAYINDNAESIYGVLQDDWDFFYKNFKETLTAAILEQHPKIPYLPEADDLDRNPDYVIIGRGMGWRNTDGASDCEVKDAEDFLEIFALRGGDYDLHIEQKYDNIPAFEVTRYSHDEPTGATFLATPMSSAYDVLQNEEFADWKKLVKGTQFYEDICQQHEQIMQIIGYNQKISSGLFSEMDEQYTKSINDSFSYGPHELLSLRDFDENYYDVPDPLITVMEAVDAVVRTCKNPDDSLETFFSKLDAEHFTAITPFPNAKELFVEAKQIAYKNMKCEGLTKIVEKNLQNTINEAHKAGFDKGHIVDILKNAVETYATSHDVER